MITLGNHRPSKYNNKYPYNCLYVHSDGTISGDCVNIQKCLLNGYNMADLDRRGTYMPTSKFFNTGDCTEIGLISQCTDVSSDFSKLRTGEPRVLYMASPGHIGGYLGKEVLDPYGHICNVVEATADTVIGNGILFSYVDYTGTRYSYKNGARSGRWTSHGVPSKYVDYSKEEEEMTYAQKRFLQGGAADIVLQQGSGYKELTKFLQEYLAYFGYYTGTVDGSFGYMTATALRNFQKAKGLYSDGVCGPKTWAVILAD